MQKKKTRRGGTLIEMLVALVLLDLALLSLAAVGAVTVRRIGEAGRRSRAAVSAANRVERLAALSCAAMTGGNAQIEPGVRETWNVTNVGGIAEITDSIEIRDRRVDRVVVRAKIRCR